MRSPDRMVRLAVSVAVTIVVLAGCAADDPLEPYAVGTIVTGLDHPTQLFLTDGAWFVAQLNGAEGDATGQILRIDPLAPDAAPVVVLDGLDKPTGVAVFAGELWVMERRRLTRGPLDGSTRTVVVDDMAYNTRSEGTLTVDADRLLFNTSGTTRLPPGPGGSPVDTSGAIWAVTADGEIENVAWGFKNAYARTVAADGTLWVAEMSDGTFDGQPAADEVVAVTVGANHGWPACVGNNRAVAEALITDPCADVPASQATFAPGATPTGLAVAPWDETRLLVALWREQRVVEVSADPARAMMGSTLVTDQLARPQHLVSNGSRLFATDHEAGTIVEIRPR